MGTGRKFSTIKALRQFDQARKTRNQLLDKSEDERRTTQSKLTALLTHQPKPEQEAQITPKENQNNHPAIVRPWLWVALDLALVFGVGAYLYLSGHFDGIAVTL